jgi:peptidoglycan-associated lipoprotein
MRLYRKSVMSAGVAVTMLSGLSACATSGALRRATAAQNAALAQQQSAQQAALASERAERAASDSALRQDLGMVRGDVQALRSELQTLRTDFGAKITAMQDGLQFAMPVHFAYDADAVTDDTHPALDRFAHIVQQYYPGSKVTVEGFADPRGTTSYNLKLSKRRADAVTAYLASQGLGKDQLNPVGYGKTRLVIPGAWGDKPGAEQNRRVVFVIESAGQKSIALAAPELQ